MKDRFSKKAIDFTKHNNKPNYKKVTDMLEEAMLPENVNEIIDPFLVCVP